MKRLLFICLCSCVIIGVSAVGHAQNDIAIVRAAPHVVTLSGYTRAGTTLTLVSEFGGKVLDVRVDVGDEIPQDGIFAKLDSTFIELELESVQVELERLTSRGTYLEKEAKRYRNLVGRKSAAQSTLDKLEQEYDQALHEYKSLVVKKKRLKEELSRHTVKAEPGLRVIKRFIEPGEWVRVGQELATLGDFKELIVPFALDPSEYQWARQHKGPIILRVPDATGGVDSAKTVEAKVKSVSPAFDPETRKINVELSVVSDVIEQRGGLRLEADLEITDRTGAVLVPGEFVAKRYEEHWVYREDGARVKVVVLGPGPDGTLRVFSNKLTQGDRLRKPDDVS